jgi:hypothetical protein
MKTKKILSFFFILPIVSSLNYSFSYADEKPISIIAGEHINNTTVIPNDLKKTESDLVVKIKIPNKYYIKDNDINNLKIDDKSKFSLNEIQNFDNEDFLFKNIGEDGLTETIQNNDDNDNLRFEPKIHTSGAGVPISHFYSNGIAKDILDGVQSLDDDDIKYLDQPFFQKDIDNCVGYIASVRFMSNNILFKQQDYCLAFGSHIPVVIKQYFKRVGLEDYKYSWNLNIIPTMNGFSEKNKITLLGYYNVPVNITSGDQNNMDAFLSLPIVQTILPTNEPNKWLNIGAVNIHSQYSYIPLSIQLSFKESNQTK